MSVGLETPVFADLRSIGGIVVQTIRPALAFVDADIVSGKDEIAREQLLRNLQRYRSRGVAPLWVNWLRQRADLRFVCLTYDLAEFNDFMLDVVRSVEYVRETRTILSFSGRADIETLLELEMEVSPTSPLVASTVMIDVQQGLARSTAPPGGATRLAAQLLSQRRCRPDAALAGQKYFGHHRLCHELGAHNNRGD
jgi:hypothetical protein